MIRACYSHELATIGEIINAAAERYRGAIPADCFHEPYMPTAELAAEWGRMNFFGFEADGRLVGVMATQDVLDATLIRHAYVRPEYQGRGIGSTLLRHLLERAETDRILVGTWAGAVWAIRLYQRHGFELLPDTEALLVKYWTVPPRQREVSVVLGRAKKDSG